MNQGSAATPQYWTDAWTGYPAARARVLESLAAARSRNPVFLCGDVHAFGAAGINAVPERLDTPLVAAEFITTSVSSDPMAQGTLDRWRANNPNVHRLDGTRRGYLSLTLTEQRLRADLVGIDDARNPEAARTAEGSFVVAAGDPHILPG
jgi:alkaline phosphatase D